MRATGGAAASLDTEWVVSCPAGIQIRRGRRQRGPVAVAVLMRRPFHAKLRLRSMCGPRRRPMPVCGGNWLISLANEDLYSYYSLRCSPRLAKYVTHVWDLVSTYANRIYILALRF